MEVGVGMPQAAGVPAARSKLARMESRAVPEVTILAEGVDGWRDGVCSLNRPTQGATPSPHTLSLSSHAFLSRRMTIGKWYRGFPRVHFGYCTIPCHLLCFVPTSKSSLCHPEPRKWGDWGAGWGTVDDSIPLTLLLPREGNRIARPRSANIRHGLVGGV